MGEYQANGKQVVHVENGMRTHIADAADSEKAHFLTMMANAPKDFDGGPMQAFDYMAEADKTCSVIFRPQQVNRESFMFTLRQIVEFCSMLDVSKKLLVRGKTPEQVNRNMPALHESLAPEIDPVNASPFDIALLHGLIGAITEAGEMAEVILHFLKTGEFDRVNAMEECGDMLWYIARALRGMNSDFEQLGHMNIDKLHGRHGAAFDVFRDANRDLVAERAKLETAAPLFEATQVVKNPAPAFDGQGELPEHAERFRKGVGKHYGLDKLDDRQTQGRDPAPSHVGTAGQRSDPPGVSDYLERNPAADIPGMDA